MRRFAAHGLFRLQRALQTDLTVQERTENGQTGDTDDIEFQGHGVLSEAGLTNINRTLCARGPARNRVFLGLCRLGDRVQSCLPCPGAQVDIRSCAASCTAVRTSAR